MVILTIDTENLPANFQEILKHEREVVGQWSANGILDQLFLRKERNGAVLVFKNVTEEEIHALMPTLPFYPLRKSLEILSLLQDSDLGSGS